MNLGKTYTSSELESLLDAKCSTNTDIKFDTISTLSHPINDSLGFINNVGDYDTSKFKALIVDDSCSDEQFDKTILFKTRNVMRSVSLLLKDVSKDQTYIESEKYPHVMMGENVRIGKNCFLYPGVFINHNTEIGVNVIIHPNAVIGSDGFGLYLDKKEWHKIPI